MENAGKAVVESIVQDNGPLEDKQIAIFCGKGNNGGDGSVAARYLFEHFSRGLEVFSPGEKDIKNGSALANYRALRNTDIAMVTYSEFLSSHDIRDFDIVIDAVFGTGFRGELTEEFKKVFRGMNDVGIKTYAIDIPSGLDATTGKADRECLKAYKTITFGLPKKGFYLEDGPRVCGEIVVKDIGFPEELLK